VVSLANGLALGKLSGNDAAVTKLTPEQLAVVAREVELMIREGERDEVWRVLRMFDDGRFNFGLSDLPHAIQAEFGRFGPSRRKNYATLVESCKTVEQQASGALALQTVGENPS
jgi:hypothetical protein